MDPEDFEKLSNGDVRRIQYNLAKDGGQLKKNSSNAEIQTVRNTWRTIALSDYNKNINCYNYRYVGNNKIYFW